MKYLVKLNPLGGGAVPETDYNTVTLNENGDVMVNKTPNVIYYFDDGTIIKDFTATTLSYNNVHQNLSKGEGFINLVINKGVNSIGNGVFQDCINLTSVTISDSVTSIGGGAFQRCTNITSINLPNKIERIGDYAFQRCGGLDTIIIPSTINNFGEYNYIFGYTKVKKVYIEEGVKNLGTRMFDNCDKLTEIHLPSTLETFSWSTFNSCYGINNIYWNAISEPFQITYMNNAETGTLHVKKGGTVETWSTFMNTLGSGWTLVDDIE